VSLEPKLELPPPPIAGEWPIAPTTPAAPAAGEGDDAGEGAESLRPAADVGWRDFFADPRLQGLIAQALENNRDLRLAEETVDSQEKSFRLTQQRYEAGAVSGLDVSQAQTTVETARVDAARFAGNVALDLDALTLLVGGPIDPSLLPDGFATGITGIVPLPAGVPSEVLLRRPDVLQAERLLRAANAAIGAARAAYFPRITLTGSAGTSSDELSGLFDSGSGVWSFVPRVTVPIFQGGRLRAGRRVAVVDRELALARYEQAIQVGFQEVADALALTVSLARQRAAQEALVAAAGRAYELSQARHQSGRDSYLVALDSQRVWYAARQGLIDLRLAEEANRVALYRVLGGGWRERSE
jgi:multidrug efflux system outer membrane protein